jgi:hypothetical protein
LLERWLEALDLHGSDRAYRGCVWATDGSGGHALEETVEICRLPKAEAISHLLNQKLGLFQHELGLTNDAVVDQRERRPACAAQAGVMKMRPRNAEEAGEGLDA